MGTEMKSCVIIGSSPENSDCDFMEIDRESSFIICADGGLDIAVRHSLVPDLIVGDFDSVQSSLPEQVETIKLKVEKDDTDMMAAIRIALQRGYHDFLLLGALGGRIDHSYANFCLLQYLSEQGCSARMLGGGCLTFFRTSGTIELNGYSGKTISVFPFGTSSCTVTYQGLKYPLTEYTLSSAYPLGVSNKVIEEHAVIEILDGSALIVIIL